MNWLKFVGLWVGWCVWVGVVWLFAFFMAVAYVKTEPLLIITTMPLGSGAVEMLFRLLECGSARKARVTK